VDPRRLYYLADPVTYAPALMLNCKPPLDENGEVRYTLARPLFSSVSLDIWRQAHAASFCLSARLLSYHSPCQKEATRTTNCLTPPQSLLRNSEWFWSIESLFNAHLRSVSAPEKLLMMANTVANKIVGIFAIELRSWLSGDGITDSDRRASRIPQAHSISHSNR
jgi:hypothetical protein